MNLIRYKSKRNFKNTPEPIPTWRSGKGPKLSFVIHKHSARKLHYDFRLEMEGVLKSWAIPKGPSMVAGEKRLAVMVEDHPLEYGKFYGEIPEGNYGAGSVEIWDHGTYKPSTETDDPEATLLKMLETGDLKLTMNGTYLKGRFALFRLKDTGQGNEWMLVKKADAFAEVSFDIETIPSLKVKKKIIRITDTKDPFPDPLPKPMLATLSRSVPDNPSLLCEPKLDGYRMICAIKDGKVNLISRNGINYNRTFKVLLDDLKKIEENVILDGEVVAENSKGKSDFQLLQNYPVTGKGTLKYQVFDIIYLSGHSLTDIPLKKRKELLEALFRRYDFNLTFNLRYMTGGAKELFEKLTSEGAEGIMVKDPESSYRPGRRSAVWIKVKAIQKQEAVICGYTLPQGSRKYFGSMILGVYDGERLKYAGNCGTGFTDSTLRELYGKFRKLVSDSCPFESEPELSWSKGKPVWLKPSLVASIKFMEWTSDEIMRMPVFMGLREDKDPWEVFNETKTASAEKSGMDKEKTLVVSGRKLKLTNLTKVFWPEAGYTKADLISYYRGISRFILPYLKDRPQSLNRHPGGITGESFYHKNMDTDLIPKWVKTIRVESGSHAEGVNYLICNDEATLVYMVNLGCIEINPWLSMYNKPEYPSFLVLDLDPGDIPFRAVIKTALVIKDICDEAGIPCYPKTSGASGMHIYIPLAEKYNYDQSRTFAEILASLAHNRLPKITSLERAVAKRYNKVYIDFLQNRKGQTIAAPYSVRPRPSATVSAPLDWKEVNYTLSPEMFTLKTMPERLEKVGDLWQPVLGTGISLSKALPAIERLTK